MKSATRIFLHSIFVLAIARCVRANQVRVSTAGELADAVLHAVAGDEILVASGDYEAPQSFMSNESLSYLVATAKGTADHPIMLRGESFMFPPTIRGTNTSGWSLMHFEHGADFWTVQDLILINAWKGVVVDASEHVTLSRLRISHVGEKGIDIVSSKRTLIEECQITNTGLLSPTDGVGISVGSDKSKWAESVFPYVGYTTVRDCHLGPDLQGGAIDSKEGTYQTYIEYNTFDAAGLSGELGVDSLVYLKGTRAYVRFNTFFRNGVATLSQGVTVVDRAVDLSGDKNVIHSNTFIMGGDNGSTLMVKAMDGTSDVIAFDNIRVPASHITYLGNITEKCCPSWFTEEDAPILPSMEPSSAPSGSFSAQFCDDSDYDTFFVSSIGEYQRCVWLESRPEYKEEVCDTAEGQLVCPELCGVCHDDCDDTPDHFLIGDKIRDCVWLRLRPELKADLCLPGSDASVTCPESCDVCDALHPSPAPVLKPLPIIDPGYFCDDDKFQTFWVPSIREFQRCVWLASRPQHQKELCQPDHPSNAFSICEETCQKCVDDCEDSQSVFGYDQSDRNCLWLSLRLGLQDELCSRPDVQNACGETCDICDGGTTGESR